MVWLQGEADAVPENADPASLPLRPRPFKWNRAFQASYNDAYPPEPHPLEGFAIEHQALLEASQQEPGPAYRVSR
ncbi:MAG: hypothetical protein RMK51_12125 [Meiothermus sp.]|uniref:hypothetical protein n=1 Tax=Meiothermus sp. TaxID=1955249 RepID=UPI00298F1AED|nr:hypothetical protein [Meiothermus sp.]MDW8426672.1 hypothetical protein [Meiothermus sp.]